MARKKVPAKQPPAPVIPKTVIVKLDDAGKIGQLQKVADLLDQLDKHDDDAKEQKRQLAEGRRQLTDQLQAARHAAKSGEEEREVNVVARPNHARWEIEYVDVETDELYESLTREMTPDERKKFAQHTIEGTG